MKNQNLLILSKEFPDPCDPPLNAGPSAIVVRTVETASRNGILVAGTGEQDFELDQDAWNGPIGQQFRRMCDTYWELERALLNGCKDQSVKDAYKGAKDELSELRSVLWLVSYDNTKGSEVTPDIGVVVSVGQHHKENYSVGDKVAVRPGDLYIQEHGKPPFRVLKDQYDPHTHKFLYDVTDSVPLKMTDSGPVAMGSWRIARRIPKKFGPLTVQGEYEDFIEVDGKKFGFKVTDPNNDLLTFMHPEDWGLEKDHCLILTECLISN